MAILEYSETFIAPGKSSWKNVHNCNLCLYFTTSYFFMVNHVRRHRAPLERFTCSEAEIETYYCKDCDFKTELTIEFKQHINKYHSVKKESRDFSVREKCDFETNLSLKWLLETSPYTRDSNQIDKVCSYKSKLENHLDNQEEKWYKCDQCHFKTRAKTSLKSHINSFHLDEEYVKWYECNQCPFKTKHKNSLKLHVVAKHQNQEKIKWYACENCAFKTKRITQLKMHVLGLHLDEKVVKWHESEECPFKAKLRRNLKRHVRIHHSEKPERFECANCSYETNTKAKLKRHGKIHVDIKSYQCEHCPYKAKRPEYLKRHMNNRHLDGSEAKWYKCEHCPYENKNASCVSAHKKIHV